MRCTVIIPTWNEGPWLARALSPLVGHEGVANIVVADNASDDHTVEIARRAGCTVIEGGTPAVSRNRAARYAVTPILAFVDADVVVPPKTLHHALSAVSSGAVDLYHCRLVPICPSRFEALAYHAVNSWLALLNWTPVPQGVGSFLVVRSEAFNAINGFSESILVGEDADFVRRFGRRFKVQFDSSHEVYVSPRRLRIENPFLFSLKTMIWAILRLTPTKASILSYQWRRYPPELATVEEACGGLHEDSNAKPQF